MKRLSPSCPAVCAGWQTDRHSRPPIPGESWELPCFLNSLFYFAVSVDLTAWLVLLHSCNWRLYLKTEGGEKKKKRSCRFIDFTFTSDIWSKCIWQVILVHFLHYNIQLTLDFTCGCSDKLTFWLNWHLSRPISEFSTNCMHISEGVLVSWFGGRSSPDTGGSYSVIACIKLDIYTEQSSNYLYENHSHHPTG